VAEAPSCSPARAFPAAACSGPPRIGAQPADKPVTPPDLIATILHLLGIRPDLELHDRSGRPMRACEGMPLRGLLA
jgi:hypothetical protein